MNQLYKTLFVSKIREYICFIKYKSGSYSFERPFKLGSGSGQLVPESPFINLIDCVTNTEKVLSFDDILMFYIQHENDKTLSEKMLQETVSSYNKVLSKMTFLTNEQFYDLFFRSDIEESQKNRIKNIRILDYVQMGGVDDYEKLRKNDPEIVNRFKQIWKSLILERYNSTVQSLNAEITGATDESVITELNSIKDILGFIPQEVEKDINEKTTVQDILDYWPTLLLPKLDLSDVS
jgi:hypothetical protein